VNEAALVEQLTQHGFEVIDPAQLSFTEQIACFRQASIVVAVHGAALANLVFADNCRVVELFSPDYIRPDCYFTLSRQLGHDYRYTLGNSVPGQWGDLEVDVAQVVRLATE
jgi:capsular polysaccharide biosynthesis protein